jgi:hypothetical protein
MSKPLAPQTPAGVSRPPGEEEVPGQSKNRAAWKYALLALIFLAWLGFLIYCALV